MKAGRTSGRSIGMYRTIGSKEIGEGHKTEDVLKVMETLGPFGFNKTETGREDDWRTIWIH